MVKLAGELRKGGVMETNEVYSLKVPLGSLTPSEIQQILDEVVENLKDPNSEEARVSAAIGVRATSLEVEEPPAFVLEAFLITMGIQFAGGTAAAAGRLFFDKVIKPRIVREAADGVGDPE